MQNSRVQLETTSGAAREGRDASSAALDRAGWAFATGILLFCGSLYLLALTDIRWLGAITPFGGIAFLLGWGALAWHAARNRRG